MINQNLLLTGDDGYNLTNSLRFRKSVNAYLSRTMNATSTTYTVSVWVKRGLLSGYQYIFASGPNSASSDKGIAFDTSTNQIYAFNGSTQALSTAVFRDPSAWYHVVMSVNSGTATVYVNNVNTGISQSSMSLGTYGRIGRFNDSSSANDFDGYMAEFNLIDGQALTPSSFGETSTTTGVWIPKKYTGTYGTNGFYLPFTDTTSTSTLGTDFSGNSNTWTVNNISLTSGSTYDSMNDVPTLTSATTANYCVMNPLESIANPFSGTSSNGNLTVSIPAPTNSNGIASTIRVISAAQPKFYIETTVTSLCTFCSLGMVTGANVNYRIRHPNDITINANDVIMTAFDPATGNVWYGRNGTWLSSGNPSAGTNPYYTLTATETIGAGFTVVATNGSSGTFTTENNFGQRPFAYTPPTGFVALNTYNLPTPTIGATASTTANKYFDIALRTSAGTAGSSVTSLNFQPDFVWDKTRSISGGHYLEDAVRGVGKYLLSQSTAAEQTDNNYISSFTSNGFTMGNNDWAAGTTLVDWCWKANGSGSTNTAGSITSTVSANTTAGFSIVTYTGTGSNATVGHGLGVAPSMIIGKSRSQSGWWICYHQNMAASPATGYLALQLTNAFTTQSTVWNNTAPTSSVFSLGSAGDLNTNGATNVAYCFSQVAGYSAFGSYTGNGSTDGTFVYTGFRPRFILYKNASFAGTGWAMLDSSRNTFNVLNARLFSDSSSAEDTSVSPMDFTSNGFKARSTNDGVNRNGDTIIYMAFAENPFKYANAR